jgi:hypothetical protein
MSLPILFQRLEGMTLFLVATFVYFDSDFSWIVYISLLFAFDISMAGYLANARLGAWLYNAGHSLVVPSLLVAIYLLMSGDVLLGLVCLWFAHIGFDRALGYGLKFPSGFKRTHLGEIGRSQGPGPE